MLDVRLSTILFQALNFFILLALLQRFLYRPVLQIMRQREATVAAALENAEQQAKRAKDERLQLAAERAAAQAQAEQALAQARADAAHTSERLLAEAQAEAARRLATAEQRNGERERATLERMEERVVGTAVVVASDLIRRSAGSAVHLALLAELQGQGLRLPPEQADRFREALRGAAGQATVELAYPPPEDWQEYFRRVVAPFADGSGEGIKLECQVNPALVAGVRLTADTMVVDLSLAATLRALAASEEAAGSVTQAQLGART